MKIEATLKLMKYQCEILEKLFGDVDIVKGCGYQVQIQGQHIIQVVHTVI